MGSLLTDIVPTLPPPSPPAPPPLGIPHSAPAAITSDTAPFVDEPLPGRSLSAGPAFANTNGATKSSGGGGSPSRSLNVATPSSSNPTSPHHAAVVLPPLVTSTPPPPPPHRTSVSPLHRRGSTSEGPSRRLSGYAHGGRPSMSSVHSDSPNDSPKSHGSHRHVGEGALDDSDSSESDRALCEAGE
jgi:WD repeat-containing protein 24